MFASLLERFCLWYLARLHPIKSGGVTVNVKKMTTYGDMGTTSFTVTGGPFSSR